jgi:hypothetical protein
MLALTLTAPWGSLVAVAAQRPELGKLWETRSWAPRGLRLPIQMAIHQGSNLKPVEGLVGLQALCADEPFRSAILPIIYEEQIDAEDQPYPTWDLRRLPLGFIVAVVTLAEVGTACWGYDGPRQVPAVRWPGGRIENVPEPELSFGDYTPGRRIWRLAEIRALPAPVRCRGYQSLWRVPAEVAAQIEAQL